MKLKGRVFKYGDNVDTDVIIPARYLNTSNPAELACHCMEDLDKDFVKIVQPGDIIVAGKNFGSGSSREHAPLAIKASGVACVIAESFARLFFRNALNIGLPILACKKAAIRLTAGSEIEVDLEAGTITSLNGTVTFQAEPFPEFICDIIKAGGLMEHLIKEKHHDGS